MLGVVKAEFHCTTVSEWYVKCSSIILPVHNMYFKLVLVNNENIIAALLFTKLHKNYKNTYK